MIYLRIHSDPTRHYYRDARVRDDLPSKEARHQLLHSVGELRSEVGGENANVTIVLIDGAETSALMAVPPLGCAASLVVDGETVFTGVVQSVQLQSDGCAVALEA